MLKTTFWLVGAPLLPLRQVPSPCPTVSSAATMSSAIAQQKKLVEQLRVECNMQRMPLTESLKEFVGYTEQLKEQDPLIIGVDKKQNPYMEKNSCTIL